MIRLPTYQHPIGVFGLARTGLAAIRSLLAAGNQVLVWDDAPARCAQAEAMGAVVHNFYDDMAGIDRLVLSPGVPLSFPHPHPIIGVSAKAQVPLMSDFDLWAEGLSLLPACPHIIAITGTNGKSTCTALATHILQNAGREVYAGGNIGTAVLDLPAPQSENAIYVLELSSYQIDLLQNLPINVAILSNIAPDHLDRHGDMAGYVAAKEKLFTHLSSHSPIQGLAVVGIDDPESQMIAARLKAGGKNIITVSAYGEAADVRYENGQLLSAHETIDLPPHDYLKGQHNGQNLALVSAALRACDIADDEIAAGVKSYRGLAHRLQPIARHGKIIFVNDSKATNAAAARHGLLAYENIYWLVGGVAKETGIAELQDLFHKLAFVSLFGAAQDEFSQTLLQARPELAQQKCDDLKQAVAVAFEQAQSQNQDAVILLSPACASFDQFTDFEKRGEAFIKIVEELISCASPD